MTNKKVAIYARVSTEHEAQLSALENQVQYYDEILARHPEWELYKRYIDEGITGTSIRKRKHFMEMLEDAEAGKFDMIITREVSRFARNTVDTLQETRRLKRMGVEVYFTEDNIRTFNDDDGELKLTIMATLAQNESKKTSQRVKAGQMISFKNGVYYGTGNILGYDKVGKEMVVNEEQAKIVRLIFSMYLKGIGTTNIKYELERRGYLTSTGKKNWSISYIARLIQNPFYCGTIVYRKSFIPDYLEQKAKRNRGEVEQIIVEGKHTPLVSKEDFNKAQEILKSHILIKDNKKTGQGIYKSVWSELTKCSCGSSVNRKKYNGYKGSTAYCFQCYKQINNGSLRTRINRGLDITDACGTPLIQEWKLYAIASTIYKTLVNDKESILELANQLIDETINQETKDNNIADDLKLYLAKKENLNNKNQKLLDLFLNEMIDLQTLNERKQDIEKSIIDINNRIEKLNEEKYKEEDTVDDRIKRLKQMLKDFLKNKGEVLTDEMIKSFVERMEYDNDKFKCYLKCGNVSLDKKEFLTQLVITKDDISEFENNQDRFKKIRNKNDVYVDIYV